MAKINRNLAEAQRWFGQAKCDLKAAKDSSKAKNFEWSCFQSQQSAEKALKGFLYLNGERAIITHSVSVLLRTCLKFNKEFNKIMESRWLDKYYIPMRYPNALPDEIPHEFYTKEEAEKCVSYAEKVIELIQKTL